MNRNLVSSIAVSLLLTSGCFGGGGSGGDDVAQPPPPPPPPGAGFGGLWSGAIGWEPRNGLPGGVMNVRGMVAETGEFRLVLYPDAVSYFGGDNEQIFGTLQLRAGGIQTTGDAIWMARPGAGNETGDLFGTFGMSASFNADGSISGSFQSQWTTFEERVGTFSVNYHSTAYEEPSSIGHLQGTYRTAVEVLTVFQNGTIFYQSSQTGCTANGSAEIIDPDYNLYRIAMDVANCTGSEAVRNGLTFAGLATIGSITDLTGGVLNRTLEMAVSAPNIDGFGATRHLAWNLLTHKD